MTLRESERVWLDQPERVVESRMILTEKHEEKADGSEEAIVKARWCGKGFTDPDLKMMVAKGETASPTLSTSGFWLVLQVLASMHWTMPLGDVTGAFLGVTEYVRDTGDLFLRQPSGGLPGLSPRQLFKVLKPLYGFNDAPRRWWLRFREVLLGLGWIQHRFCPCVFLLVESGGCVGILGVHVDDVVTGGAGQSYTNSIVEFRRVFPFRKWLIGAGKFRGSRLTQKADFSISASQEEFAQAMKRPKCRMRGLPDQPALPSEISSLKSVNGSVNWLASETRPDLASQVSLSQQNLPTPTLGQVRQAAAMVRRAKQFADLCWIIPAIRPERLMFLMNSDSSLHNATATKGGTQAGYLVGVADKSLLDGSLATWGPSVWKSRKLRRTVESTLSAESQIFLDGIGHMEWLMCMWAEVMVGPFALKDRSRTLRRFPSASVSDCKSVYDHFGEPREPAGHQ